MRILFRADASIRNGTGHIVRCAALAGALRRRGAEVCFACRAEAGHLNDWLTRQGFDVHELSGEPDDIPVMETLLFTLNKPIDWLIVDHYHLDARWESALRHWVKRIFVIDDLANRPHDCDALLDQNRLTESVPEGAIVGRNDGTGPYQSLISPRTRLLLGPRYALLRPPFAQAHERLKWERDERTGPARRILAFFGGTDPTGETVRAIESLDRLACSAPELRLQADVVVGGGNPRRREIERLCAERPHLRFHCQTEDMAGLMASADLSVTAGGGTTWERLCLGLPGLVVAVADNQIALSREVALAGAQVFLGRSVALSESSSTGDFSIPSPALYDEPVVTVELLQAALARWTIDEVGRRRMMQEAFARVDGRGADRVADFLCSSDFCL